MNRHRLQVDGGGGTLAVRHALLQVMADPLLASEAADLRGTVEIVLAEVLNNIVEHAYACDRGRFAIRGRWLGGHLCLMVRDHGGPMPQDRLPEGAALDPQGDGDPPEGGFGWFLIRSLSVGLRYRRHADENRLLIVMPPQQ